jgi:2'-5' RNA ligase
MAEHVGLFLPLPERLARQYPPEGKEGEDTSPPHLTLVYIGDVDDGKVEELREVLSRIVQAVPPMDLRLLPPTTFQNEEGQTILHSPVAGPQLEQAHNAIKGALQRRGFDVKHYDEFKPHVTIEYIDPGERSKFRYLSPKGRWRADSIGFWVGEDRQMLPLGLRRAVMAAADKEVRDQIVKFFEQNPDPGDDQVHELAESLGINPHEFESMIYSLLTDFVHKRDTIACLLRAGRPDLANVVARDEDPALKALKDEMEKIGKIAIDMVAKRKPLDIGAYFSTSSGQLDLYSDAWNGTSPETKKRLIDLKYEIGNALKSKTRRRILEVQRGGKKVWTHGKGSFGTRKFVDGYSCGFKLMLTPEEEKLIETVIIRGGGDFKAFSHKPIISPKPAKPAVREWEFIGHTYQYRDVFKRNKGRFIKEGKSGVWIVPADRYDDVIKALKAEGAGYVVEPSGYGPGVVALDPPENVYFVGRTFPVKDLLKKGGARWEPNEKAWTVPDNRVKDMLRMLDAEGIRYEQDGEEVWLR